MPPEIDPSAETDLSPERVALRHLGGRIKKNLRSKRPDQAPQEDSSSEADPEAAYEPEDAAPPGQKPPAAAGSQRLTIVRREGDLVQLPEPIKDVVTYSGFRTENLINSPLFPDQRPVVLGVTSAVPGEGKTTVALRLAMDIARYKANRSDTVCLVDMSLGEDTLSHQLKINTEPGLVNILEATYDTFKAVGVVEQERLSILPAGKTPDNPARAARSAAVVEVLNAAAKSFDVVIVDLPSISSGNVAPIAPHLDAILMVVYAGVTPKEMVAGALEQLDQDKVVGIVLNRFTRAATS
jgi:Mrp family chromosome partitioning ATPase